MKISIPRVTRPIALSDYAPEYGDQEIQMWVNPPRERRLAFATISDKFGPLQGQLQEAIAAEDSERVGELAAEIEALGLEIYAWYAGMWSQGKDKWTAEDVKELAETALDADPGLWSFLQDRSLEVMGEYRRRKKASSPEPRG